MTVVANYQIWNSL